MLDAVRQAGNAYKLIRLLDGFNATLSDEQKLKLDEVREIARGMAKSSLPEEVQPIAEYVLADDGDPILIKAMGAYLHPAVKTTLGQLTDTSSRDRSSGALPPEGIAIKCRECGHMAQYGLDDAE